MKRCTRVAQIAALAAIAVLGLTACGSSSNNKKTTSTAAQTHTASGFTSSLWVNAVGMSHNTSRGAQPVIGPDDMAYLDGHVFVGFQNGVGSMGETSPTGNKDSTIVEFDAQGHKIAQWDVVGKNDGLGADPTTNRLIATVNEDGSSSVYLIDPTAGSTPVHYHYSGHLPHGGGTDAISVDHGVVLITASAPGTTGKAAPQPNYPAVYRVTFNSSTHVATAHGIFSGEGAAVSANTTGGTNGKVHKLALTDPDSSEIVPPFASRFAGDFMLDAQGDLQEIFVHNPGASNQSLSALKLSSSVDDAAWVSDPSGALYTTDNVADAIYKITGPFAKGSALVAVTPCNANKAPATCPGPGYPQNYLGQLNLQNGEIAHIALHGQTTAPKGMLFIP
jgi:hypothetical protein